MFWVIVSFLLLYAIQWGIYFYLQNKFKYDFSKKLQSQKENHEKEMAALHTSLNNVEAKQNAIFEKQFQALEVLWKNVVALRDITSQFDILYDITPINEIPALLKHPAFINVAKNVNFDEVMQKIADICSQIKNIRPYVSKEVYELIEIYQFFSFEILTGVQVGIHKNELKDWRNQPFMRKILTQLNTNVLTKEDWAALDGTPYKIAIIKEILEDKISTHITPKT